MEGTPQQPEKQNYPKVVLRFMRHSLKEKAPEKDDNDIQLSPEGRLRAAEKAGEPIDLRFGHTVGSPRLRTRETAAIRATGDAMVRPEDLGVGKSRIDNRLNFVEGDTEYGHAFNTAYLEGRVLSFLVYESDALARETGDIESTTYSRAAANVAGILRDTYKAAQRGVSILEQSSDLSKQGNDFQRMLGTHATIQESFLLKLVDKMKGRSVRDELMVVLGNAGIAENDGFVATVAHEDGQEKLRIAYSKDTFVFDEEVSEELLEAIIAEGAE